MSYSTLEVLLKSDALILVHYTADSKLTYSAEYVTIIGTKRITESLASAAAQHTFQHVSKQSPSTTHDPRNTYTTHDNAAEVQILVCAPLPDGTGSSRNPG